MTKLPIKHENDIIIVMHPILDEKGRWTERVYLSVAHSTNHKLHKADFFRLQETASLACAAIYSMPENEWLVEFLEDEIAHFEEAQKKYEIKDNIIKIDFRTKTKGNA